jgi:hypothetical protein
MNKKFSITTATFFHQHPFHCQNELNVDVCKFIHPPLTLTLNVHIVLLTHTQHLMLKLYRFAQLFFFFFRCYVKLWLNRQENGNCFSLNRKCKHKREFPSLLDQFQFSYPFTLLPPIEIIEIFFIKLPKSTFLYLQSKIS